MRLKLLYKLCPLQQPRGSGLVTKTRFFTSLRDGNKEEIKEKKVDTTEEKVEEKKPGKIKQFWLKYGVVGICTYVGEKFSMLVTLQFNCS